VKILQINKAHHYRGGANRYYMELSRILEEAGHEVVHFSMKDGENVNSPYSDYFVENVDLAGAGTVQERIRCFGRVVYSFQARRRVERLIKEHRPEIAHLHNIYHQISPSILQVLKKNGLRTVLTAHDYKLICPNYTLFDGRDTCEKCLGGKNYHVLTTGCHGGTLATGMTLAIEAYLHLFLGSYRKYLDIVITPSRFMKECLAKFGIPDANIIHVPNFVDPIPENVEPGRGGYILYMGRLSREKGVDSLILAMREFPETPLIIAGDGPERKALEKVSQEEGAGNVQFVGQQGADDLGGLLSGSMFTVVPSIWYENCPLSVLESMAYGRPVIGSKTGGIPDLIGDGEDGLLFSPGDVNDLSDKIGLILGDSEYREELGMNAHLRARQEFTKEAHRDKILSIYSELLDRPA